MKPTAHIVSVSGGKDSTATLLLALRQFPDNTIPVFADTGNEHELTLEYLDYLERTLGVRIHRLRASFNDEIARKREWVKTKWPEHGVAGEKVERALAILQPTGNPYLDLCIWKGRFPSRKAQFCTERLKTLPLTEFQIEVGELADVSVWSWQGVRRDESHRRSTAAGGEYQGGGIFIWRPIAGWTAQQTVDFVRSHGLALNPLYGMGMDRVGCMPCINAKKAELAEISRRFPEHIERIAEWERIVSDASKRDGATFFTGTDPEGELTVAQAVERWNVRATVIWAKTVRGGKVADPIWDEPAPACSSSYGLCE
jgi:3'-phosphoadenosine 5'-phosphosulfate sulfotransferase (PAPS reductase)/FAD synthetase